MTARKIKAEMCPGCMEEVNESYTRADMPLIGTF